MDHLESIVRDVRQTVESGYYRDLSPGPSPTRGGELGLRVRPRFSEAIALRRGSAVIAELKPASPGAGALLGQRAPAEILSKYARSGAVGISVLTEPVHFGGSLELLVCASRTGLPTLMKDFIIAPEQIVAAALCGASAVLVIVTVFERHYTSLTLEEAIALAHEHDLEVLAEVASVEEFLRAQRTEADMIGINNRDLVTLHTDLGRTEAILRAVRKDRVIWSLSGIETAQEIRRLRAAGADAFLVGAALMRAQDPAQKLRELIAYGHGEDLRHPL
uniref:indole-3-glycerol-phosphate synthase n=1 Tax=Acetithermum autotrophicum TaxID=1446466 RepID=H5SVE1_ACEAU|nr:indole-3-glycerol-phosphate synthase [Candidatus Acetothermum autotrophicum]